MYVSGPGGERRRPPSLKKKKHRLNINIFGLIQKLYIKIAADLIVFFFFFLY